MRSYTLVGKAIQCPFWDIKLTISGKYKFIDDQYKAEFLYGICPIIENNQLPEHKRERGLALYAFCENHPCDELNSFKPTIDITKDGYSQK